MQGMDCSTEGGGEERRSREEGVEGVAWGMEEGLRVRGDGRLLGGALMGRERRVTASNLVCDTAHGSLHGGHGRIFDPVTVL